MPNICYVPKRFQAGSAKLVEQANAIIGEYESQGYTLTLRQLFYQYVSRDLLPNTIKAYKTLGSLLNDARLAGEIDWNAMEDRTRNLRTVSTWGSPAEIISACASQFRSDFWGDQECHVDCWVEKDALIGVLEVACEPMQIPYFSCRGYTSVSELWSAAMRYVALLNDGKRIVILHLGDHDPSGIDMTRDIEDRIRLMLEHHIGRFIESDFIVRRIALNMEQIDEYNPPPNPAKMTDSRASSYINKYGDESWELDALAPDVLMRLIQDTAGEYIDNDRWEAAERQQAVGRETLGKVSRHWEKVEKFLAKKE